MLSSIWNSIVAFVNKVIAFLHLKHESEMDSLMINIRFESRGCIPMAISPQYTIHSLKQSLSSKIHLPASNIKLIFAGKELNDSDQIQDFDMGQQSIIHAVHVKKAIASRPSGSGDSLKKIENNHDEKSKEETKKVGFYIYCCSHCKSVQPGKLRVRCNVCKQGTLVVSKDPCGWDDVLEVGRIPGVCQSEGCPGDIADFYFKCSNHITTEEDSCVSLYLIRNNISDVPCMACTDICNPVLVFPCTDGHVMCLDCFRLYCLTKLNDRQFIQSPEFGYTLSCPAGCENSLIKEIHHFKLLGKDEYSKYHQFGAEECLLQAGGVLCPRPGCGAGILPDPDCRRIVCPRENGQGCGFVFCRNCLQGYHLGECFEDSQNNPDFCGSYRINAEQAENARWEEASKLIISSTTKPCPKCRTPTERDGGCMHMVCTRPQCGFHWCWICQSEWTRDCMGNHWFG